MRGGRSPREGRQLVCWSLTLKNKSLPCWGRSLGIDPCHVWGQSPGTDEGRIVCLGVGRGICLGMGRGLCLGGVNRFTLVCVGVIVPVGSRNSPRLGRGVRLGRVEEFCR